MHLKFYLYSLDFFRVASSKLYTLAPVWTTAIEVAHSESQLAVPKAYIENDHVVILRQNGICEVSPHKIWWLN